MTNNEAVIITIILSVIFGYLVRLLQNLLTKVKK